MDERGPSLVWLLRVDVWKGERAEGWKGGRVEGWTCGRVEGWTCGRVDSGSARHEELDALSYALLAKRDG